jgi:SlyX protein
MSTEADIRRLEEKIAYLERHVTEQDKAMLEMTGQVERLKRELLMLRDRLPAAAAGGSDAASPAEERPPHY